MDTETKPLTRLGKKELINKLLSLGYTAEQLLDADGKGLKRPELVEKIKDHEKGEEGLAVLADIDTDDEGVKVTYDKLSEQIDGYFGNNTPELQDAKEVGSHEDGETEAKLQAIEPTGPSDPRWTQYVLGKFLEDEVDGKNPRVEGLRRIAEELVGDLIEEGCDLVAAPTQENHFRACVKAWGVFVTQEGLHKRFEALADAHEGNCLEDYATYLVAMADTRAKGRMFRNALCLRRVVAAEEISKTVAIAADVQQGGSIHTSQISLIRLMADRNNLSISDILDGLSIKYEMNEQSGDVNLQSLTYEDALVVAKHIRVNQEQKEKK